MLFEWHKRKADSNLRKHGISFGTACQAFYDPLALSDQDRIEDDELRWQMLARIDATQLILVVYTIHEDENNEDIIRIISARKAGSKERERYARAEKISRNR